tara:strand:+ start:867 stop:1280 length:414 start_codon:yes stop_codon:yes gene_type:complete
MIGIIGCGSKKQIKKCRAEDMYLGSFFKMSTSIVKKTTERYFILSAKYGVLNPSDIIEPYELKITDLKTEQYRRWIFQNSKRLQQLINKNETIYSLASDRYNNALYQFNVYAPMTGLTMGYRNSWLRKKTRQLARGG